MGQKKTESMKPARLNMSVTIEYGSGGSRSYGLAGCDTHIFVTPWAGGRSIVKYIVLVGDYPATTLASVVVYIHNSLRAGENQPSIIT